MESINTIHIQTNQVNNIISAQTLAQQCYLEIKNKIIDGVLLPGQKLKMAELKAHLNTGQSPIREALSRLIATGLVETEDNKGFRVTKISEYDIRDIYRTYLQIELLAITQAIQLGDLAWRSNIIRTLYELSTVEITKQIVIYEQWSEKNYNFHVALISGCNSPVLLKIRKDIYRRFDRYCRIAFKLNQSSEQLIANHQEHQQLANAVLQHDLKLTEQLLSHHILGSLEDVIQKLKNHKLL